MINLGNIQLDWVFIAVVVLSCELCFRLFSKNNFVNNYKVWIVMLISAIVGGIWFFIENQETDSLQNVKNIILNYCVSTSMYEVLVKQVKKLINKDKSTNA